MTNFSNVCARRWFGAITRRARFAPIYALRTCERYHRGRPLQRLGPEALRR